MKENRRNVGVTRQAMEQELDRQYIYTPRMEPRIPLPSYNAPGMGYSVPRDTIIGH